MTALEEPPKKKLKVDDGEVEEEESTTQTIVDSIFLNIFDDTQRNNVINECLAKLLPFTIIEIIQMLSNTHFSQMHIVEVFRDLTEKEFIEFSKRYDIDNNYRVELPEILKDIHVFGDIVLFYFFGNGIIYIIDDDDKLTNITTIKSFVIPSNISDHFNNPLLFFAKFNKCIFEIDLSLNSRNLINFISSYLSKFNINKELLTKLHEIGIPNDMKCLLVFPQKTKQKSDEFELPYLEFNYLAYHPNLRENIKICRKFHLKENIKNIQNQIIIWLRLLDLEQICFTKCKWNTWNANEQHINLQLLEKELSEYGYWTEQSQDKYDNCFIIKGNINNIKYIKAILNKTKKMNKFIIYGQLTVCKLFDEEEYVEVDDKKIIFEENEKKEYIINLETINDDWRICLTEYYDDRCIAIMEGPVDKIDEAITKIYKLNMKGGNIVTIYADRRIGTMLEFEPTSLSTRR